MRAGYAGAAGVFVGDAVLMLLTALGAASLLRAVPALFIVIKVVGAGYLTWVGLGLLRNAWQRWRSQLPPERELALIAKLKLSGYFLIVWDIVEFCR